MNTEPPITETELVNDAPRELQVIVQQNALQVETAKSLHVAFHPFFAEARNVIEKSRQIVVTDAAQKLEMKLARECRLSLKAIRVASDKARKELKDESLRKGRAIDGFHSILLHLTETEEKRLQDQEDFVERKEQGRKAALKSAREQILTAIQIDPNLYQLGEMSEETFQQLVEGTRLARAAEADRRRKEEAEYIEREAKEEAERQRIRQENERLKKEAEEKEVALKGERERVAKERADAEAKAQAERAAAEKKHAEERRIAEEKATAERKKLEAEKKAAAEKARKEREALEQQLANENAARKKMDAAIKAQSDAAIKRRIEEAEAARKAAAAPDKDRLINYANAVRALEIPELKTQPALETLIQQQRDKFVFWLESSVDKL